MKFSSNTHANGFTLIEMMIVVALIAILSAIAMPAYNNYINRGKIKTVQADLVALSLSFENEYRKKMSYPNVNYADKAALTTKFTSWAPASKATDFSFSTTGTASSYSLVATGVGGGVSACVITLPSSGTNSINLTCPYTVNGAWL